MGKTLASVNAIKTLISTNHANDFDLITKSMRDIFGALQAAQVDRGNACDSACLVAPRFDTNAVFSQVTGKRVSSSLGVSVFLVVNQKGRTIDGSMNYEAKIELLLNLVDTVAATLDGATPTDGTNFYKLQIGTIQDIPDVTEGFVALEIPIDLSITRAS
jgi:hypothetical protein